MGRQSIFDRLYHWLGWIFKRPWLQSLFSTLPIRWIRRGLEIIHMYYTLPYYGTLVTSLWLKTFKKTQF